MRDLKATKIGVIASLLGATMMRCSAGMPGHAQQAPTVEPNAAEPCPECEPSLVAEPQVSASPPQAPAACVGFIDIDELEQSAAFKEAQVDLMQDDQWRVIVAAAEEGKLDRIPSKYVDHKKRELSIKMAARVKAHAAAIARTLGCPLVITTDRILFPAPDSSAFGPPIELRKDGPNHIILLDLTPHLIEMLGSKLLETTSD